MFDCSVGLAQIGSFMKRHPTFTDGAFGEESCGDKSLIMNMRRGKMPGDKKANKIKQFMENYDAS